MTLPAHLLDAIASAAVREGIADAVFTRLDTPAIVPPVLTPTKT